MVGTSNWKQRTRYLTQAAISGTTGEVTRGDLLNHYLMGTSTAFTCARIIQAVRVISVEMWSSPISSSPVPNLIQLTWVTEEGPQKMIMDTSVGTAEPAHLISRPPKNSLAGFWSYTGSSESVRVMDITCPQGTVIDVVCEYVLQNDYNGLVLSPVTVTTTLTPTANILYVCALAGATYSGILPEGVTYIY
jgi:hypothetical protein